MGSFCFTPLEQAVLRYTSDSIRKNPSAGGFTAALGHKQREHRHADDDLRKRSRPVDRVECIRAVCENELAYRLV